MMRLLSKADYPNEVTNLCLDYIEGEMADFPTARLLDITEEEVAIWKTPPGILYNTIVIQRLVLICDQFGENRNKYAMNH